ncbi:MAG: hypothetical protein HYV63_07325 [Candidatus Schekmanbacteria bacterium]|nr:hypothetical protein [Candidatus Schekmanbacteria bacterium]
MLEGAPLLETVLRAGCWWGETLVLYLYVPRHDISYFSTTIQAYGGVASIRTCLPRGTLLEATVPREQLGIFVCLSESLAEEVDFHVVDAAMGIPCWWGRLSVRP